MEEKFLINSKIDVPRTQRSSKRLKGLRFCIILLLIMIVFSFLIDDFDTHLLRLLILPIALYLYYKNKEEDKGGLISTSVEITLNKNELIMNYLNIDRRDGMGSRREIITFPYPKVYGFEFNTNLICLRIAGKPNIQVQFENQNKYPGTKIIANGEDTKIHFLYLESLKAKEFLDAVACCSNIQIDYKEQFSSGMLSSEN